MHVKWFLPVLFSSVYSTRIIWFLLFYFLLNKPTIFFSTFTNLGFILEDKPLVESFLWIEIGRPFLSHNSSRLLHCFLELMSSESIFRPFPVKFKSEERADHPTWYASGLEKSLCFFRGLNCRIILLEMPIRVAIFLLTGGKMTHAFCEPSKSLF